MASKSIGKPAALLLTVSALVFGAVHSGSGQVPGAFDNVDELVFQPRTPFPAPAVIQAVSRSGKGDRQEILDLEQAVVQAELIVAVRLVDVTETKIIHGGRTEQVTQQYRFEPVRVLKGIFAREALLMTGQDLGIYRFAASGDRLERGQLMLVLLGRQGESYFNCNGAGTLSQSIPRLEGRDDPLLAAVDVLIASGRARDRQERVNLLRDGLKAAKGRDASPLLLALGRRALLAARSSGMVEAIAPLLNSESPALRAVAAKTLGELLEAAPAGQEGLHRGTALKALRDSLDTAGPDLAAVVATIDAIGSVGAVARNDFKHPADPNFPDRLSINTPARTIAESAAKLRAAGKIGSAGDVPDVVRAYAALPLDASIDLQDAAGHALVRLDPKKAAELIPARLMSKAEAGLGMAPEIALLGTLPADLAAPGLLQVGSQTLNFVERLAFAQACASAPDARLVPALATMLDPSQYQVRAFAEDALIKIDTDEAASTLWPHLQEQINMSKKLELIAFLGRHGFRDGGSQAIEHLSQVTLRDGAVEALASLGDVRVVPELRKIWATSNDLAWNAAAIRALARLGQADIAPKLLAIARTPGDPLAASALIGLGDLGSAEAVPIVRQSLNSRSDDLVIAASKAAVKLLARPRIDDPAIRDRLASLLVDADASVLVRDAALDALIQLKDPRLAGALATVARDASLEATPLLARIEAELTKRPGQAQHRPAGEALEVVPEKAIPK
jgi:HEAT repeat protein